MIFAGPLYGKVLRSEKTQCRRLHQPKDPATRYKPGKRICVQKAQGVPVEAHIVLTDVRRELLGAVDYDAARAEGFRTTDEFKAYWIAEHDKAWLERAEDENPAPDEISDRAEIADRFYQRWALKEVWVLTFELDRTERPRLLADRNARADYVDAPARALDHEPEAVDAATQTRFSREGHQGWVAREMQRQLDRERMSAAERLARVQIEAKAAGVDISQIEISIRKRLREAERKIHQRRAA